MSSSIFSGSTSGSAYVTIFPSEFTRNLAKFQGTFFYRIWLVVVEWRVSSEVVEDGVSVEAIHLDLLEDGESTLVLLPDEGLDLLRRPWLLQGELVARESEDLESFLGVLLIQGAVFVVVVLRETSLRCNISLEWAILTKRNAFLPSASSPNTHSFPATMSILLTYIFERQAPEWSYCLQFIFSFSWLFNIMKY